jgi:hypothetical protein
VPPFHLRVIKAYLLEHRDPFIYVYLVLHMFISFTFVCVSSLKPYMKGA